MLGGSTRLIQRRHHAPAKAQELCKAAKICMADMMRPTLLFATGNTM
jgi:hypothetical protein